MKMHIQNIVLLTFGALMVFSPHISSAAVGTFKEFMSQLIGLLDLATLALFSLAIVFFFWQVVRNLWGYDGGNVEQRNKLNQTLFWGILILFVMVSIWGIIAILQQTLSSGLGVE